MKNNRKKRKLLITAIVVLSLVLALLVGVAVFLIKSEDTPAPSEGTAGQTEPALTETVPVSSETAPGETEPAVTETKPVPTTEPVADMTISTPFCELHFPEEWKDMLKTEFVTAEDGGCAVFTAVVNEKETEIFKVNFSRSAKAQGTPIGVLDMDGAYVLVCLQMDKLDLTSDWTTEEYRTVQAMRESVNHMIQYLRLNPDFSEDFSVLDPEETQEYMQIETPFVTLKYPGKWADQVNAKFTAEGKGGYVTFTGKIGGKDATLFVLHFGSDEEDAMHVGYIQADGEYLKIGVQMNAPENADKWTEEENQTFAAMQEGFNDLIEALEKEKNFTTDPGSAKEPEKTDTPDPTEAPAEENQSVSTPYGELWIPGQWKDQMYTQSRTVNGGHAVTFIGKSGGHEVVLFTILYGTETDTSFPVGTLRTDKGTVTIHLELAEIDVDNSWSDEDVAAINAMQESINEILDKLSETSGFKAS